MKILKLILLITLSLFLFVSCGPKNAFKNWEEILVRGRFGLSLVKDDGLPLYSYSMNNKLERFIIENRDYLYKKDPKQYYYDRAVIDLMLTEYISSFEFFRKYIDNRGSLIKASLQYQGLIALSEEYDLSNLIANNLLWYLVDNPDTTLTDYEVAYLIFKTGYQIQYLVPEIFNRHLMAINKVDGLHHMFIDEPPAIEEELKKYNPEHPRGLKLSYNVIPESFIKNIEGNKPNLQEIEFIFLYYYKIRNYEKAYEIYKNYYFSHIEPNYINKWFFTGKLLQILYETKRYDELFEIYEWGIDNNDLMHREETHVSGYYWIACTYAQQGDFANTIIYLQKALDISTIQKEKNDSTPFMQPNTFALIWEITMNDVFDKFREDGRYEKIKEMMNAKLSTLEDLFIL